MKSSNAITPRPDRSNFLTSKSQSLSDSRYPKPVSAPFSSFLSIEPELSLSTVVLNSRDRQGMYGMQHFRAPINKPHNSL